jgi:glucose 1-dehydrogenase
VRAIAVVPGRPETAGVIDLPEPPASDGSALVRTQLIGVCGTDVEIARFGYGVPPPGEERLVLGHESLGEVLEAPDGTGLSPGDLVVGVVRRPDPVPCPACAADQWDMRRNGGFVERGIKEHHGYGSERFRIDPRFAIRLDPALGDLGVLLEPTSVVAKAWDHADRIGARAWFEPKVALITGAGPIGLLAALLARQRGLETHVVDRVTEGAKPQLVGRSRCAVPLRTGVRRARAARHRDRVHGRRRSSPRRRAAECPGRGRRAHGGISQSTRTMESHPDEMNKALVLGNMAVFGSVNASRRHYYQAAAALAQTDPAWLKRIITRRLPPDRWPDALDKHTDDIKVVVDMTAAT